MVLAPGPAPAAAQAMPFHTPTAMPLALAENAFRGWYQRSEMRDLMRDGERSANPEELRVRVDAVPIHIPYGLSSKTTLFVGVPYLVKTLEARSGDRSERGLGDVTVMVKQEVLRKDFPAGNRRFAVFGGVSLPIGDTGVEAEPLPEPLRLGLGTFGLTGSAVYSHVDDRIGAHGRLGYEIALGREFGVRPGDRLRYDLALGYRILPGTYGSSRDATIAAYFELDGIVARPSTRDGSPIADSGGHTLFAAPGVQLVPVPNWALEASVQLPIVREPRGEQLAPSWSFAIGARVVTFLFGHGS